MQIAFTNATVFDGINAKSNSGVAVFIDGAKIREIGRNVRLPQGVKEIDAAGLFIMPGLIDTHVHFGMPYTFFMPWHPGVRWGYVHASTVRGMQRMLSAGVTSARDMGGLDAGFVDAEENGLLTAPRLAGNAVQFLTPTNGSLDLMIPWGGQKTVRGDSIHAPGLPDPHCDGPWECRKKAREVMMMGAEIIKIGAGGCLVKRQYEPTRPTFTPEEIEAFVDEGRRQGVKVHCHVEGGAGLRDAIACGVDCIEHGWDLDDALIDEMARRGTWWVPTFWNCELVSRESPTEKGRDTYKRLLENGYRTFSKAHKAGVNIAMGSDGGSYDENNNASQRELELMCEAGLSAVDAIIAGTRRAAELLGVDAHVGTLEAGKEADILVLDGDPLKDIRHLQDERRRKLVLKGGAVVGGEWSRSQFDAFVAGASL